MRSCQCPTAPAPAPASAPPATSPHGLLRGSPSLRPFPPRVVPPSPPRPTPSSAPSGPGRGSPRLPCPGGFAGLWAGPRRRVPLSSAWRSGASWWGPRLPAAFPLAGPRGRGGVGAYPLDLLPRGWGAGALAGRGEAATPVRARGCEGVPLGPGGVVGLRGRREGRQRAPLPFC